MTKRMTTEEIEAIRKRTKKATSGNRLTDMGAFEASATVLSEDIPALLAEVDRLNDVIASHIDEMERRQKLYDDLARKFAISGGDA